LQDRHFLNGRCRRRSHEVQDDAFKLRLPNEGERDMKKILFATIAASAALAAVSPAVAAQGCGRGFHRGYHGRCIPNHPRYYGRRPVVGVYYHGRGWWDGHRYWHNRYRWHGGWRYR
jgi:hypothetical protein